MQRSVYSIIVDKQQKFAYQLYLSWVFYETEVPLGTKTQILYFLNLVLELVSLRTKNSKNNQNWKDNCLFKMSFE